MVDPCEAMCKTWCWASRLGPALRRRAREKIERFFNTSSLLRIKPMDISVHCRAKFIRRVKNNMFRVCRTHWEKCGDLIRHDTLRREARCIKSGRVGSMNGRAIISVQQEGFRQQLYGTCRWKESGNMTSTRTCIWSRINAGSQATTIQPRLRAKYGQQSTCTTGFLVTHYWRTTCGRKLKAYVVCVTTGETMLLRSTSTSVNARQVNSWQLSIETRGDEHRWTSKATSGAFGSSLQV